MNKGDDKYDIKVPNHTSLYLSGKTNINNNNNLYL